ncbi:AMP-binding protein [Agrobacterium larrymoorei]|uniref:AMP-binding protein n=1 Tax=Agrobacterium salinitolerans TaxID=1183413 RepID=A0A4Z1QUJ2_9HYPH|nr:MULTISPECIES: AMP-binding protein [Rhizobium/Agrobacterium group]MDH6298290.1 D-alanine--poly(phosphoribitol) ligase subunit 1 [Agrobacterium fabrum]NTJ45028.1 AMP-binding protein [Agrobacterium larrymoorei]TKV70375.1 hypothetical protein D0C28_26410 [Rhizobium sp. AU243]UYZ10902.1 AMP-binding protein [Agrobacterium salinitolerans]
MSKAPRISTRIVEAFVCHATFPAISAPDGTRTYDEMLKDSRNLFLHISRLSDRSSFFVATTKHYGTYLAALTGVVHELGYVPINPALPPDRVESILHAVDADVLVATETDRGWAQSLIDLGLVRNAIILPIGGTTNEISILGKLPDLPLAADGAGTENHDPIAYVLFTSGTTGTPKGIPIRHSQLDAYLTAISNIVALRPSDRCSQVFELSFDLSVHDMFATWMAGACLCIPSKRDAFNLGAYIMRENISVFFCVPSAIRSILIGSSRLRAALDSVRLSLFCGEALTTNDARQWLKVAERSTLINLYGPTEATIAISSFRCNAQDLEMLSFNTVPIGFPIGDSRFHLEDEADGAGQLCISGRQVFGGYLDRSRNDQAFAKLEIDGAKVCAYRTGDIVALSDRFGYVFKGRTDDQVKVNGFRIELLDIEATVERHLVEAVAYAFALQVDGATSLELRVYHPGVSLEDVRRACAAHLPSYMMPRRISSLQRAYFNSNGKKDRRAASQELLGSLFEEFGK